MGRTLIALLVALPFGLLAVIVAAVMVVMADEPLSAGQMFSIIGLHLFSSVALAEGLRLRYQANETGASGAWHLGLVLALLIPGFGALLVGVMVIRPPRSALLKTDDFITPMEYRKQQAEAQLAAEGDKGHAGVQVEAISDALKDEDKAKRLGAVEALRSLQNKEAVELLGKSLKNTVFEVRFHAVEALATINQKYSSRIAKATEAVEKKETPENYQTLGEVYHEYAVLEMEEASIQLHLFRNAKQNLQKAITPERPPTPELLLKVGTCLEALGEYEQAWHTYKAVLNQQPQNMEGLLASARLQYRQAQFKQLPTTCRQILDLGTKELAQDYINVLALWAEGPEAIGLVK